MCIETIKVANPYILIAGGGYEERETKSRHNGVLVSELPNATGTPECKQPVSQ